MRKLYCTESFWIQGNLKNMECAGFSKVTHPPDLMIVMANRAPQIASLLAATSALRLPSPSGVATRRVPPFKIANNVKVVHGNPKWAHPIIPHRAAVMYCRWVAGFSMSIGWEYKGEAGGWTSTGSKQSNPASKLVAVSVACPAASSTKYRQFTFADSSSWV